MVTSSLVEGPEGIYEVLRDKEWGLKICGILEILKDILTNWQ